MTDDALTIEILSSRIWCFSRADGTVICPRMRLSALGEVLGFESAVEDGWRLGPDLELVGRDGRATTRFTERSRTPGGGLLLRGRYLADPEVGHELRELDPTPPVGARVAVMVRAHNASEKLFALLDALSRGSGYDVFLAADETRRALEAGRYRKVAHSEAMCADLGLMRAAPMRSLLWYFGDYAFYCFFSQRPAYDHYVMIEYDVGLSRPNSLAVEHVVAKLLSTGPGIDLVAPYLGPRDGSWMWSGQCSRRYHDVRGLFFPIVSLSRSALEFLFDARRREAADPAMSVDPLFCESFVPSCLQDAGQFRSFDLNHVLNGAYEQSTFRGGSPLIAGNERSASSAAEFLHPVFSLDEYVGRVIDSARDPGRRDELFALLDGIDRGANEAAPRRLVRLGDLGRGLA